MVAAVGFVKILIFLWTEFYGYSFVSFVFITENGMQFNYKH